MSDPICEVCKQPNIFPHKQRSDLCDGCHDRMMEKSKVTTKLKPCPCCGGKAEFHSQFNKRDRKTVLMIACSNCWLEICEWAYIGKDNIQELKQQMEVMWNTRHKEEDNG